jgi:hypothetical protein
MVLVVIVAFSACGADGEGSAETTTSSAVPTTPEVTSTAEAPEPQDLPTDPLGCSGTVEITEESSGQRIEVGQETSRFSICLDPVVHPLADLRTDGCPFGYVSNYSLNGPDNYPIGFQVTGVGSCTVRNGDFQVEIVATP